jgi:putative ABC transport system substrate-binding protein
MDPCRRRQLLLGPAALLVARRSAAQPAAPVRRRLVGILEYGTRAAFEPQLALFKEGLRGSGFEEGRNLAFEARYADDDYRKLNRQASDLVRSGVEVILASHPWSVHAAKAATRSVPIVFWSVNDPVALNFVESLARPGGNITGVSVAGHELTAKRLELMREAFPAASRIGVVYDEDIAKACQIELDDIAAAGERLGVEIRRYPYRGASDLRETFDLAQRAHAAVLLVPTTLETRRVGSELAAQAASSRMPIVHSGSAAVDAGGLMSFGPAAGWAERRAGEYVARILNGAKAAELPVERPMVYELTVNLRAARAIGVQIPARVLMRATHVIE